MKSAIVLHAGVESIRRARSGEMQWHRVAAGPSPDVGVPSREIAERRPSFGVVF